MKSELFKERSATEREQELWIASEKYMRGEISVKDLEKVELPHASEFKAAMLAISRERMRWFFVIFLIICFLVSTTISLVIFSLSGNFYALAILGVPVIFLLRATRYLLPLDDKRFQRESMKIQMQEQRSPKVRQLNREEL
jgi:hypothetical protein